MSNDYTWTLTLRDPQRAHADMVALWYTLKPMLHAGHVMTLTAEQERRSEDASAKFHKLCDLAAKSRLPWAGKPRTKTEWKVLFVSGHSVATKQGADIIPGLESEFVNIRESTARMSRARSASLIDYTTAFLVSHGVEVNEPETV
jgi:hypothetical protein